MSEAVEKAAAPIEKVSTGILDNKFVKKAFKAQIRFLPQAVFFGIISMLVFYTAMGLYKKEKKYDKNYKAMEDGVFKGLLALGVIFLLLSIVLLGISVFIM